MKLSEVVELLNAEIYTPDIFDCDLDISFAFASDLMSDALMLLRTAPEDFFEEGILCTGLATNQSIRTAEMLDFRVVLMVRDKHPNQAVLDGAINSDIIVLGTSSSMFSACGKLWENGIKGVTDL